MIHVAVNTPDSLDPAAVALGDVESIFHSTGTTVAAGVVCRQILNSVSIDCIVGPPSAGGLRSSPIRHVESWRNCHGVGAISTHRRHQNLLLLCSIVSIPRSIDLVGAYGLCAADKYISGVGCSAGRTSAPAVAVVALVEGYDGLSWNDTRHVVQRDLCRSFRVPGGPIRRVAWAAIPIAVISTSQADVMTISSWQEKVQKRLIGSGSTKGDVVLAIKLDWTIKVKRPRLQEHNSPNRTGGNRFVDVVWSNRTGFRSLRRNRGAGLRAIRGDSARNACLRPVDCAAGVQDARPSLRVNGSGNDQEQ